MKASVIICTYNRADSLSTALECLQWQSYDNFEVIVVNGPSTDHTSEVLEVWGKHITVIHNPEKNPCLSRNLGTNIANGDILCYLDDDSEPDTPWLANIIYEFNDPAVGGVTGPTIDYFGVKPQHQGLLFDSLCYMYSLDVRHPRFSLPRADPFIVTHGCNMAFRRCALKKAGGFLEELVYYGEEPEICRRIIDAGYKIINTAYAPMVHRIVATTAVTNMRHQSSGVIDPFHPIKNKLYVITLWGNNTHQKRDYIKLAKERVKVNILNAKYRYDAHPVTIDEDQKDRDESTKVIKWFSNVEKRTKAEVIAKPEKLTRDEYHKYRDGATKALNWFVNFGHKANFIPTKILENPHEKFLKFKDDPQKTKKKMTICLLAGAMENMENGVVKDFTQLAKALAKRGHEVHLIGSISSEEKRFFVENVHHHYLNPDKQDRWWNINEDAQYRLSLASKYYKKVLELQATRVIDIVMGNICQTTSLFCHLDESLNTVLSMDPTKKTREENNPHLSNTNHESLMALESFTVTRTHHIRTINNYLTQKVTVDYPGFINSEDAIFMVPSGYDGPVICPGPREKDGKIRILLTGPLHCRNDLAVWSAAAAQLIHTYDHLELILVDDDPRSAPTGSTWGQDFEAQYPDLSLSPKVHFLNNIYGRELQNQYTQCDIFCRPCLTESQGISFVEAMAYGKPIVGCRAGGISEIISEGETGVLVEPGHISSLVEGLKQLITDKSLREKMGMAARKRYEDLFTIEKYSQAMENHFYRIAKFKGIKYIGNKGISR